MPPAQPATRANGLVLIGGQWMPETTEPAAAKPKPKGPKKHKASNPKAKALLEQIRAMQAAPELAKIGDVIGQMIAGAQEGWINNQNRKKLLHALAIVLRTFAAMAEQ
jgi:hypothetical protein